MMEHCVLLAALGVCAWFDVRKGEFPLPLLGACALMGMILFLTGGNISVTQLLGGVGVGGMLLVAAWMSREGIGLGDGLLFCVTGLYLGLWQNLVLLFLATLFCAGAGLILIAAKKYTRKQSLPFAPFVLVSDVLMLAFMM